MPAKVTYVRVTGYLMVAAIFVVATLLAVTMIRAAGWHARDFALVVGAIVASQCGTVIWFRQFRKSDERSVKFGLAKLLAATSLAVALTLQATIQWFDYPEVAIPISVVGCFLFPFAVVGPLWKGLQQGPIP